MTSEQVTKVFEAEEMARQAEQDAMLKATSLRTQAGRDAADIIAKETSAAEKQASDLFDLAKERANEIIDLAQKESVKERVHLRSDSASRWEKSVSAVVSAVIGQ